MSVFLSRVIVLLLLLGVVFSLMTDFVFFLFCFHLTLLWYFVPQPAMQCFKLLVLLVRDMFQKNWILPLSLLALHSVLMIFYLSFLILYLLRFQFLLCALLDYVYLLCLALFLRSDFMPGSRALET